MNSIVILELKISHSFEHFTQVRTHITNFLCLRENFKQLIIRQEIETSEIGTLLLKIVSETLLHDFKILVSLLELFLQSFFRACK